MSDRLRGSGVQCRSFATVDGTRHKLHLASIKVQIVKGLAVRAGVGVARFLVGPGALEHRDTGLAAAGTLSLSLWDNQHLGLDLNMSAARVGYGDHALTDGTVLLTLRAQ